MTTATQNSDNGPRILVPLDGSPFSEYALPVAVELARRLGAHLDLARSHLPIAVMPTPGDFSLPAYEPAWDEDSRQASQAYLEERAARIRESGVNARTMLLDGRVARALEEHIEKEGVSLVVTTTHGRGGISRVVQGSVVDELIRLVSIPVLTLRPPDGADHHAAPTRFDRILVALDGSSTAAKALAPAAWLAAATGASLLLLHVVTPSAQAREESRPPAGSIGDPEADPLAAAGLALLEDAAAPLRARGLPVETLVRVATDPADCILSVAAENHVGCITIATHGRGGLTRLLFGSVADRVFRGASLPVMILRAEEASSIPDLPPHAELSGT